MAKQVEDIVVRLVGEGFEALDKIKGSFRELGKVTNLAEKDILSARDSLLDYARKAGNTEAVNKGLTDAFKGLRSQVDLSSEAYRSLSAELRRLDEESKGATRSIMAQRDAVLSSTAAGTQNVAALQQQRAALIALRAQTRDASTSFDQFSADIQAVETRLTNLAEVSRRFNAVLTQGTAATAAGARVQLQALTEGIALRRQDLADIDTRNARERNLRTTIEERIGVEQRLNTALSMRRRIQFQEGARTGREGARTGAATFNDPTVTAGFLAPDRIAQRIGDLPNTTAGLSQELGELNERLINTYKNTETYIGVQLRLADIQRQVSAATQGFGAALRAQLDAGTLIPSQKNLAEVIGQLRREMLELDQTTTEGGQAYANNARQANQLETQLRELAGAYRQVGSMATVAATAEQNAANARIRNNYLSRGAVRQQEQALRELGNRVQQGVAGTPLLLPAAGQTSAAGTGAARSGGARNRLVDAAGTGFAPGVEATFSASLDRRLKTAGERSGYFNPPTAAVGTAPAVGFAGGAGQRDALAATAAAARATEQQMQRLRAAVDTATKANTGSATSLGRLREALVTLRNEIPGTEQEFRQLNQQVEGVDRRSERMQTRRRPSTGELVQAGGAAISGGIFGGPEGFLGGVAGGVVGSVLPGIGTVGGAFAGAAGGAQLGMFRQQLAGTADYAASIGKLQIALRGVVGSQEAYDAAIRAAAAATRDLNIPQEEATRGLTRLSAAVIGAGGTVADSSFAFRAMSEAIKATGGNAEQVDGALLALTQVFSKGKVSAEELNQIAERLPGTFTLFAQAAGKTGPELQKALEQGEVGLNDLMKFLALTGERYGTIALDISKSSQDAGARLTVAFQAMRLEVGNALQPLGAELQGAFATFISDITPAVVGSAKAIAAALTFFTTNEVVGGLASFALQAGVVALAIKGLLAASTSLVGLKIASWFAGAASGAVQLQLPLAGATTKVGVLKAAVTGLGTAFKALLPFAVLTFSLDIIIRNSSQLKETQETLRKIKEDQSTFRPGLIGPVPLNTAERRFTGASRETLADVQQRNQVYIAQLRKDLVLLERQARAVSNVVPDFNPVSLGQQLFGLSPTENYAQQKKEQVELQKLKIQGVEEVLNLESGKYKTQADIEKARQDALKKKFASPDGEGKDKAGASLLQAIQQREEALLNLRTQREEQLAQIREQAVEQAKQIETQLADRRLAIERQIQDITRQRSDSAEDSARRIREARGEDSDLIAAEQRVVDIFREERDSKLDSERRLADDKKQQEETIATFQRGVAKSINDANRAHTRSMGEIQKQYATSVAKIIDEGTGNAGKRLAAAAQLAALYIQRGTLNSQIAATTGLVIPVRRQGGYNLSDVGIGQGIATPQSLKEDTTFKGTQVPVRVIIDGIDPQIEKLQKEFNLSRTPTRTPGIGDQFTALLGAEGGYEDVASQKPLPIQRMQQQAARPFLELWKTWESFSNNVFGPSKEEIKRVTKPDPARNKQVLERIQRTQTAIDNYDPIESKWKEIDNKLREVKRSKPATMSAASLVSAVESIYTDLGSTVRRAGGLAVKAGERLGSMLDFSDYASPQQSQTIGKGVREVLGRAYERSIMFGGDKNAFSDAIDQLAPLTRKFGGLIEEVLQIEALKGYIYAEKALPRLRLAPTPAARPEERQYMMDRLDRMYEQPYITPGIQNRIEGASLPGTSFDVSRLGKTFGEVASASFIGGLLAQNSGAPRPDQVGDTTPGPPAAYPIPGIPSAEPTTLLRNNQAATEDLNRQATTAEKIKEAFADVNREGAQFTNGLNEQLQLLEDQRTYLDMGFSDALSSDLANLDRGLNSSEAVLRRITDQLKVQGVDPATAEAAYDTEKANLAQVYAINVKLTQELEKQAQAMRARQDDRIGEGMKEGVQSYLESIGTMRQATEELTLNGIKGVENAIFDLVTTGKTNFREFAADILRQTARMIIQQLVMRNILLIVKEAFKFGGGGVFAPNLQPTVSLPSGYAKGGTFANNIIPYAKGGAFTNSIVSKPTLFKFAAGGTMQTGVMGEAGPEAIMPLSRGANGKLGVSSSGGGGGTTNVTVNVDASGSKAQGDSAKSEQLGRAVSQAVQDELLKQKRPGGLLA